MTRTLVARHAARLRPEAGHLQAGSEPEDSLRADHAGPFLLQQLVETLRMEWHPPFVDEVRDAVLLGLRRVLDQRIEPARMLLRFLEVEESGAHHRIERNLRVHRFHDFRLRVERPDHAVDAPSLFIRNQVRLVQQDHVREIDLIAEQVDDAAFVFFPQCFTAFLQTAEGAEVAQEVEGVHHGHHGVDLRDIAERAALLVLEGEGFSHRHGLADAGRFD
jgi:hypothetical protein